MAKLKIKKLKRIGNIPNSKLQLNLNNPQQPEFNIGNPTVIGGNAPNPKNVQTAAAPPDQGDNPYKLTFDEQKSSRLFAADLSSNAGSYRGGKIDLTSGIEKKHPLNQPSTGREIEVCYKVEDNAVALTLGYLENIFTLTATFIREFFSSTLFYFQSLFSLLTLPLRNLLRDRDPEDSEDDSSEDSDDSADGDSPDRPDVSVLPEEADSSKEVSDPDDTDSSNAS